MKSSKLSKYSRRSRSKSFTSSDSDSNEDQLPTKRSIEMKLEQESYKPRSSNNGLDKNNSNIPERFQENAIEIEWKKKCLKIQTLYDESQEKIKELLQINQNLNKELKETRNIEPAQERHKNTLERLKTKFAVFENTVVQKHKESYAQLEQENKMLQMELIKMKTELDRTKDTGDVLGHYVTAFTKLKSQLLTYKEKIEALSDEIDSLKQENSTLQKVNHDHELRYEELLHMFEEEKRKLSKETDNTKRKLMQEIQDLKVTETDRMKNKIKNFEETVIQQKELIEQLQFTISKQREDYNLHLQAALELATSDTPPTIDNLSHKHQLPHTKTKNNNLELHREINNTQLKPKIPFKRDLELLDKEIEELQQSLEQATLKLK